MPVLMLVRHGQASFGGADYDVLSDLGRRQAQVTADRLRERGVQVSRVTSGTLKRQLDTARPIAAAFGLEVEADDRWDEYDLGDVLGHHSTAAVREQRAPGDDTPAISSRDFQIVLDEALRAWIAAGAGGPAAEPFPVFRERVEAALSAVTARIPSGTAAVAVTSGGVLGAVCMSLLGLAAPSMIDFNRVAVNASITKLVVGRGGITLVSFNEHAHLEGAGDDLVTYR